MDYEPHPKDVSALAEVMYSRMFANRATRLCDDKYGLEKILRERARLKLINEAKSRAFESVNARVSYHV